MSRAVKTKSVTELTDQFKNASGAVLTDYRGLTVAQLRELRTALRGNADYAIVKNTLTKIAAKDAGIEGLDELLVGPSAIAFVTGDVVAAAKGLKEFGKGHPALIVKGGFLEGKSLTPDEIQKLADLDSREVLLAKLAGAMKASMSQAAALFAAPLAQAARTVEALRVKAEADPAVLAGGAGEPAVPPVEAETAPDTAPDTATDTDPDPTPETDAEAPAAAPAESSAPAEETAAQEG